MTQDIPGPVRYAALALTMWAANAVASMMAGTLTLVWAKPEFHFDLGFIGYFWARALMDGRCRIWTIWAVEALVMLVFIVGAFVMLGLLMVGRLPELSRDIVILLVKGSLIVWLAIALRDKRLDAFFRSPKQADKSAHHWHLVTFLAMTALCVGAKTEQQERSYAL